MIRSAAKFLIRKFARRKGYALKKGHRQKLLKVKVDKIDCWRNSEQKHRWLATTVLEIEPRLRKVRGHRHLPRLRAVLQSTLRIRRTEVA